VTDGQSAAIRSAISATVPSVEGGDATIDASGVLGSGVFVIEAPVSVGSSGAAVGTGGVGSAVRPQAAKTTTNTIPQTLVRIRAWDVHIGRYDPCRNGRASHDYMPEGE
jgi:hypothetical protein